VSIPTHAAVFVAIVVAVRQARWLTGPTDTHGSARWATRADLGAAGLVEREPETRPVMFRNTVGVLAPGGST
jgi:hypothetical protein